MSTKWLKGVHRVRLCSGMFEASSCAMFDGSRAEASSRGGC
jgi:hypothetical protein